MTRALAEETAVPVAAHSIPETPGSDNSELSLPLAVTNSSSSSGKVKTMLDKAADAGLRILQSPRVRLH